MPKKIVYNLGDIARHNTHGDIHIKYLARPSETRHLYSLGGRGCMLLCMLVSNIKRDGKTRIK